MNRFLLTIGIAAVLSSASLTAAAQQSDSTALQIAELRQEVAQLKTKSEKHSKLWAAMPKISGFGQVGYEWNDAATSTFYIKRARVSLSGDIAKGKVDYKLQIEFKTPNILDLYFRYKPYKALNFQVGQFKMPRSFVSTEYTPLTLELIDYPLVIRELCGYAGPSGIVASGRDLGAQIYGSAINLRDGRQLLSYNLAVSNGAGVNTKDNNKSKDIMGRLMISPLPYFIISSSYYWGQTPIGTDKYAARRRFSAGLSYDRPSWVVRGEYMCGTTAEVDAEGFYVTAGYRFNEKIGLYAQYDFYDANKDSDVDRIYNYTLGVKYQPFKHLFVQANYVLSSYSSRVNKPKLNTINLMITGVF